MSCSVYEKWKMREDVFPIAWLLEEEKICCCFPCSSCTRAFSVKVGFPSINGGWLRGRNSFPWVPNFSRSLNFFWEFGFSVDLESSMKSMSSVISMKSTSSAVTAQGQAVQSVFGQWEKLYIACFACSFFLLLLFLSLSSY